MSNNKLLAAQGKKKELELRMKRIEEILTENEYQSAEKLSDKTGLEISMIYVMIRKMRIAGIGILTTNRGYVLSAYAKKVDDVNFLRRLYGRRTSDFIAISAAEPDIKKRWSTQGEKESLRLMLSPMTEDVSKTRGMRVLLACEESLKV
jgi:biotin operon repressor